MASSSTREIRKMTEPEDSNSDGVKKLAGFSTGLVLTLAGSWILYSHFSIDHKVPLPDALPAERKPFDSPIAGRLSYYQNSIEAGRPLVLIHSINAAASAYEMRPLFLHYRTLRPVFALDLPGFGFSERTGRVYSPELYEAAILDFIETQVKEAVDVVALSLSSEFAARAAQNRPELFNSLVVISPSGFRYRRNEDSRGDLIHTLFAFPLWARPFYDLLTTRASIRYFLQKSFIGPVPSDLVKYDYSVSHQPGAEHAPLYFISGKLFTPQVRQAIYEQIKVPALVLYDRDNFVSFEMLPDLLAKSPYWQAVRLVPSMGLPHFEQLENTVEVLDKFWK